MPYRANILYPMHPVNRAHPLAHGLTGWWLVHPLLNSAGTRWLDLTQGKVGTFSGLAAPPTATSGWQRSTRPGSFGAIRFDGTNDRITTALPMSTLMSATTGTIALWMRPVGAPVVDTDIFFIPAAVNGGGATSGDDYIGIYRGDYGSGDRIWVYNDNATAVGITYTVDEWVHVTLVHSLGTLYGYKNGVLQGSVASGNTVDMSRNIHVGSSATDAYFAGMLDDIRVYSLGLDAAMVGLLYQNSVQGYPGLLYRREMRLHASVAVGGGAGLSAIGSSILGQSSIWQSLIAGSR